MTNEIVGGVQIVRVHMPAATDGENPVVALWVAAVPRDQAVQAVRHNVPADWVVELTDQHLSKEHAGRLNLRPGDVREMSMA